MKENLIRIKGEITMIVDAECKMYHICEKEYIWYPAICSCKNGRY